MAVDSTVQGDAYKTSSALALKSGGTLETPNGSITTSELEFLDLSVMGAAVRCKKIAISATPTGSEQDSGWDLPAKAVVLNVFVDVTTVEAVGGTKTLDVGTLSSESGGDADGFVDGVSVATSGLKVVSLVAGAVTRGLLIKETVTGSGAATHASPVPYSSTAQTAKSISYTAGSNDFTAFRGAIYIVYVELG